MSHSVLSRATGIPRLVALSAGISETLLSDNHEVWVLQFPLHAVTIETESFAALLFNPDDSLVLDR